MKISEYVTLNEAIKSNTASRLGIDNTPSEIQLSAMQNIGVKIFDPIRESVKCSLGISSFFRCKKLNEAIGGSTSSQHGKGEAIDIDADIYGGTTNKEIFSLIYTNFDFDQLIWEFGNDDEPAWIHVSLKTEGKNRNQTLQAYKDAGKTKYKSWD